MNFRDELKKQPHRKLKLTLTLPYVVLYGLGVTVGAGIYVLVGEVISQMGNQAPLAFLVAGLVMLLPAACFAEFTGRLPFAAAEAHFVGVGFNSKTLFLIVGLAVAAVGIVSSAAITHGAVNYLAQLVSVQKPILISIIVISTGGVACLGIRQSIGLAGVLTLVEIGALIAIIVGAQLSDINLTDQTLKTLSINITPTFTASLGAASLLAFFAFVGFEDIDSIAEETKAPQKTLPLGIFTTLFISLVIYCLVVIAALAAVPMSELTASDAPLTLVFERTTGMSPLLITLIALIATINGIIVQMIMSARVLYGLANRALLPRALAHIHPATHTPVIAALFSTLCVLALALMFPIVPLAEWTSIITLIIFMLVCLALIRVKQLNLPAPEGTFIVPMWVPYGGAIACLALLVGGILG